MRAVLAFLFILGGLASAWGQGLPADTSALGCLNSAAAIPNNGYGVVRCSSAGKLQVEGSFTGPASQPVTGAVSVTNFPPTQPVTVSGYASVLDLEMTATRAQKAFVASATMSGANPTVGSGNFLNVVVCNAAGSGKLVTVFERRFDSSVVSGTIPMSYGGITSPAPIATPTVTSTGANLYTGGPTSTAVTVTAAVSSTRLNNAAGNAVPSATGFIPVNGIPLKLLKPRVLPAGTCFGNYIVGQNQSAAFGSAGAMANLTIYWTEE